MRKIANNSKDKVLKIWNAFKVIGELQIQQIYLINVARGATLTYGQLGVVDVVVVVVTTLHK